ncbi:hypothetical protein IJH89_00995 [Candidatus Saccharibacteria bacterium]|nr:hypothetical protein [Candidatus Saccharibacteria bacterium]
MGGIKVGLVKKRLRSLKSVATWKLFLVFIPLVFLSATLLRLNHQKMTRLRDEVLAADEEGNDVALAAALNDLQSFVSHHEVINVVEKNGNYSVEFGTGVFFLESSYRRAATAALDAVADQEIDDSNPNGNIYAAASAVCRPRAIANGWTWDSQEHIDCYMAELSKYPADSLGDGTITVDIPSSALYRREFSSPVWTFSLTGLVSLATALLGVVIFIKFLIWGALEIALIIIKTS